MKATSPSLLFNSAVRLMAICGESRQTSPVAKATAQEGDLGSGDRCNRPRRNWVLDGVAKHLQILAFMSLCFFLSGVSMHAQATTEELNYIQTASQTYVIGTLMSGDLATATIRLNNETRHVPLRQGVQSAYGVFRGWLAFTAKAGAAQEEFFVMDTAGDNPLVVLTADRILRASWRPGHSAIAVAYQQAAATHVAIYDIETQSLRQVDSLQSDQPFLFWSRDGETLNYITSSSGSTDVQAYDANLNTKTTQFMKQALSSAQATMRAAATGNLDPGMADSYTVLVNVDGTADPNDFRTPLILIHGIESGAVSWKNNVQSYSTDTWDQFIAYYNQSPDLQNTYKVYEFIYQSDLYQVLELAKSLNNHIDEAISSGQIKDVPFVILAHSMGGLISRTYMSGWKANQGGNYKGLQNGERIFKLITLGTPHHGTPAANGPSRDLLIQNADDRDNFLPGKDWISVVFDMESVGEYIYKTLTPYDQPNRNDLWWDNLDNEMSSSAVDIPQFSGSENSYTKYDGKISAFYGYYRLSDNDYATAVSNVYSSPQETLSLLPTAATDSTLATGVILRYGLADASGNIIYPQTDGFVPDVSASFVGHSIAERVECPGYSHTQLHDDRPGFKCNAVGSFKSAEVIDAIHDRLTAIRPWAINAAATMQSPNNGSALSGSTVTFTWDLGSGVEEVELYVGTGLGLSDIFSQWEGIHTSQIVSGLPTNGQDVYVTLRSKIGLLLQNTPYTYIASGTSSTYALTVSTAGSGTVTSSDGYINCGSNCTHSYSSGSIATLNAAPISDWNFSGWSGACSGTGSCILTMSATRTATATFTQVAANYGLTVMTSGSGTVTSNDGYINCGSSCTHTYSSGASVTLNAAPLTGWNFSGWSGACSGTGSCTLTMGATRTATATFTQVAANYALTISTSGSGTVTSSDGFINCGSSCTHTYSSGASVTLNAAPARGWSFSGWSGACGGTGSCVVTMSATTAVSATFTQQLSDFTISPTVVASGGTANLTIALSAPAPTYGAWISLASSNSDIFPVTRPIIIPAGQTTLSRTFAAGTTTTSTAISVTASYNGSSLLQATVTVNAAIVAPTVPVDFGAISIGQASATIPLTFTFDNVGTLGSIAVLTGGATGLDFANSGTGTCTARTYNADTTCTVDVIFTPKFAGLSNGAVILKDDSGNAIATTNVHGNGLGPQVSFLPGSQSTLGSGFNRPTGVAVDGSGNVFVSSVGDATVKEILAVGGYKTVNTFDQSFSWMPSPDGVAVDGSGNVFVADAYSGWVYEILAAGGYATAKFLANDYPQGIALDGSGNLFFTNYGDNEIKEILAAGGYATVTTLAQTYTSGGGFKSPGGVAVDADGNIFVSDLDGVKEILAEGGYTTVKTLASGLSGDLAVAGSGNVFVTSWSSGVVYELLATSGYTTVETLVSGFNTPAGVAVDRTGNVFVTEDINNRVLKLDIADAPSLSFKATAVGSTSSDSPQTVTLSNNGNAALTFSILSSGNNPSISSNFTLNSSGGTACPLIASTTSSAGTLAAGVSCTLSISFAPTSSGSITGSLVLTNNNLNVPNSTQTISLSGTGTGGTVVGTTTTLGSSQNPSSYSQSVTITATVAATNGTATPIGTVQFSVDGSPAGSAATLSSGSATYSTNTLAAGTHSITAVYSPGTGSAFITSSATPLSQTVNKATSSVTTWPTASSITYGQTLASSTLSGGTSTPAGSFAFTTPTTAPGVGTASQSVTFTPTDTTDYLSSNKTVSLTVNQATPTINWATPAAITYGTALSATQLNATSTVPGGFAYTPVAGTVLAAGMQTLSTTFTPSDTTDYSLATKTVSLVVNQATPAATPTFSPAAGTYSTAQTVTISTATPNAIIYYTLNLSVPTTGSAVYSGPLTVSTSQTISAAAIAPGYSMSLPAVVQYIIGSSPASFIYTVAGDGTIGYRGDRGLAAAANFNYAVGTAVDSAGNLYIADQNDNRVRKVAAGTGIITTVAGNGTYGYSGDGGPAINAQLSNPQGLAVDSSDNLYIADNGYSMIRKVTTSGAISTVLGGGKGGYFGPPSGIAIDRAGNIYVADPDDEVVWKATASTGTMAVFAGGGGGNSGDNGPATSATLQYPSGIALDSVGNLYIADYFGNVVRKVTASTNVITTVAGVANSNGGYHGDGYAATSAILFGPQSLVVDSAGNLYIDDQYNNVIRKVTKSTGIITTIAGNGPSNAVTSGDGGPATSAGLVQPSGISIDSAGNIYEADTGSYRVREITAASLPPATRAASPAFSVSAGTYSGPRTVTITDATPGASIYITMDGATPTAASDGYNAPINVTGTVTIRAIAVAPGYLQSPVATAAYTITSTPTSIISTVAGNGVYGFSGAGGAATSAQLGSPFGVALDSAGNLYIPDQNDNVVWKVAAKTGIITIVAGNGTAGFSGDGGPATSAQLNGPRKIAIDAAGNLYIADRYNQVIRKVSATTGIITTFAGTGGSAGYSGDGGQASAARLGGPDDAAIDNAGNLYIAEASSRVIRKVNLSTGIITTWAGNHSLYTHSGDGGLAINAGIEAPEVLAFDSAYDLYVVENWGRVRKIAAGTGIISTVAGTGEDGYTGDGGLATNAEIWSWGLAVDPAGSLYLSNYFGAVRMISPGTGVISTVVGYGLPGYSGDGGSAGVAGISAPYGITFDPSGNLYIADLGNSTVRKVTFISAPTPTFSRPAGGYANAQSVTISDTAPGAVIYYTTDGTIPTPSSSVYSGAITVSANETLQAIAIATGYSQSPVGTAAYKIDSFITPTITWPTPAPIPYGTALSATQLNATSTVGGTFSYNPPPGTVLGGGSQTLSVTFTPTNTTDYTTATATVQLTVNQATPSVTTWPTASSITYGQTLTSSTLSGGASTQAGSFAFTTPTTAPGAGTASQSVTFTPTDTTNYSTLTGTASVTVNKASSSVTTWPTASSITYGQTLTSSTLSGGASTPAGSFAFTTPTTKPNTGTASQSVTFTPTDTTDYSTLTGTASVTVGKASSTTALVSSLNPSAVGQSVNLTATVKGQYGGTPTGSVTFSNGSTSLGSASLSGGVASLATTALPQGTNSITAVYSGDTNFAGSTSNSVSQVVNAANPVPLTSGISPAFASAGGAAFTLTVTGSGFTTGSTVYWGTSALTTTFGSTTQLTAQVPAADIATGGIAATISVITPSPGGGTSNSFQFEVDSASGSTTGPTFFSVTQSVTAGSPASYPVTLPSTVESASITCLNLPTGASCSYSATTNTVTITTTSASPKGTYQVTVVFLETVSGAATSWILLPILLLPLVFLRRRLAARGVWVTACLGLVLLAGAAFSVIGCGGGGGASSTPPPQTHQVVSSGTVSLTLQ